ncbi:MAG: tetratricopeptide repeat protein [Planctomycetes bacterium]|nr:tetratricopeptide repeat protein [Planctomycetota bacterium]
MKIIEKISNHFDFVILTSFSVLFVPFVGLSSTIDPVLTPRFIAWCVIVFILLVSFFVQLCANSDKIDYRILRRSIFPVFLGYLLFSLISLTKALNITEGIYEILKIMVSIVYLFLATIILSKNRNYIPILIKTIIVAATALSLIGFYEYVIFGFGKSELYPITGTMAQRNLFSSALFLMLPFCLYSVLGFHNYWKFIGSVSIIPILTLILLNQTRSVWVGLFVSVCITTFTIVFLFKFRKLEIPKALFLRRILYIATALIISCVLFGYLHLKSSSRDSLADRAGSILSPKDSRNTTRIAMWRKTIEPIKDNIFLGIGAGNWKIVLPSYNLEGLPSDMFKTTFFVRPENDYLWVLSEIGILGFVCYLSIFVIVIIYVFNILTKDSSTDDKLLSILIFFGVIGYMVISFFAFPKERIFHSIFLILMMAIVVSKYNQPLKNKKNVSWQTTLILAVPCLLLLLIAIVIGYNRLRAEFYTKRAFAAREAQNWPMVISEIDKGYSAFATLDPMSTPLKWYRGEANYLLNKIPQALEDFKKAHKAHPYHIHVLNNLATCYEIEGDHDQAIFYYKKALNIFPEFEEALINLGATYYNADRYEEAYRTLLLCDPNTKDSRLEKYLNAVKEKLK